MERYFAYWYYKDDTCEETYLVAKDKEDAMAQILDYVNRDEIKEICLFKEIRGIKY